MSKVATFKVNQKVFIKPVKRVGVIKGFKKGKILCTYFDKENNRQFVEVTHKDLARYRKPFIVKVKKLSEDAIKPEYKTKGAAGFDLATTEDIVIQPGESAVVSTGLAFEIPNGSELEIRGRSGNAFKHRVFSFNGTIDSDYRGEVRLLLINLGKEPVTFEKGDRVAQGVIKRVRQARFVEVDELSETERGDKGFGSTGK